MFGLIAVFPSPAACEGFADLFVTVGGSLGVLGIVFSILGIRDPNSIKKWISIIINVLMVFSVIHDLIITNSMC